MTRRRSVTWRRSSPSRPGADADPVEPDRPRLDLDNAEQTHGRPGILRETVADLLLVRGLDRMHRPHVVERAPEDQAVEIFQLLDVNLQKVLLRSISNQRVAEIINEMDPDDRTKMFSHTMSTRP